jgi:signal transduction histidine kinase
VAVALALIVTTTQLVRATELVAGHFRARIAVADLKSELLAYGHVGELARAGWTPQLERLRGRAEARLQVLLGELAARTDDGARTELVRKIERRLATIAEATAESRRSAAPDDEVAHGRRAEEIEGALTRVEALERLEDAAIEEGRRHAALVDRVANAIGGVALLMVALMPVGALALRRWVSLPLTGIAEAIRQLRLGAQGPRAPEQAPTELSHVARTFNETAEALAAQRRAQLAFVAGVAHDLRTPIGALRTAATVLRTACDGQDERASRALGVVVRQTDRLARMVDDLLDASRIEAGELSLARETVDAREVARRCVETFADVSSVHQVTLVGSGAPALVEADPWRLEQVVVNLLENAIKYSPAGGPVVVDVRARGGEVLVEVSDRGEGISPAQLGQLFEPFRRGDQPHAGVAGSGLGLSIVRRIVTAHGGDIDVESTPKVGTTFRVRLPRAEAAPLAAGAGAKISCAGLLIVPLHPCPVEFQALSFGHPHSGVDHEAYGQTRNQDRANRIDCT